MCLQMETAEKLAERFGPNASFEAKHEQSGHDQSEKPVAAYLCFPQRRLGVAGAASNRLEVPMHTAFGKSGSLCMAPITPFGGSSVGWTVTVAATLTPEERNNFEPG